MDSRELAKQVINASEDMDYLDYTEAYETEVDALTRLTGFTFLPSTSSGTYSRVWSVVAV